MSDPFTEITSDDEEEQSYAAPAPPPRKPNNGARFLAVVLKLLIMSSALFFFFLFAGIAAVILLHLLVAGRSLRRRRRQRSGRGMVPEELKNLPAFKFSERQRPGASDCAICLEKFREGEKCRKLPRCGHFFHRWCVDRWIVASPDCPICRTGVREDSAQVRPLSIR